jgi:hypothetical protein
MSDNNKQETNNIPDNTSKSTLGKYLLYGGLITAGVASIPIILGFGTVGIASGSIAAGIQSSIGLVKAGSAFAFVQSAGMSGYFATTAAVGGAAAAAGGVTAAVGGAAATDGGKTDANGKSNDDGNKADKLI